MLRRTEYGGIVLSFIGLLTMLFVFALLYTARHPLLRLAGSYWVLDEPVTHADVIIVLGDDDYQGDRAAEAATLFRQGVAPQVVASGRWLRPYASMADMMALDLEKDGVPEASVIKFSSRAVNTRDEAVALRGLVVRRGWKRIVVVTSNYRTRRAEFICRQVLPDNVTVRVASAPDSNFDSSGWWQTRQGQKLFFNEVLEYILARWELRHGNVSASPSSPQTLLQPAPRIAGSNQASVTLPYPLGNNLDLHTYVSVL